MNLSEYISLNPAPHDAEKSTLWAEFAGSLRERFGEAMSTSDPRELLRATAYLDKALHYGFIFPNQTNF